MRDLLVLALAGAAGTLSRYALSGWAYRLFGGGFPYGTLAVNVIGCFLVGLLMEVAVATDLLPAAWRLPLAVGFLGAFTTFSAFGYETLQYLLDGAWGPALSNVGANLLLGVGATWIGFVAARGLFGGA